MTKNKNDKELEALEELLKTTKKCTQCKMRKNINFFSPQPGGRLGVRAKCQTCCSLNQKEYRDKIKEKK